MNCRWNRLENLLVQGRKDSDFAAKDALQPVLKLLLGPDGEELRTLVVKEAVRVVEAILLGTAIDSYYSVPDPIRTLIPSGSANGFLRMNENEQATMLELRDRVLRIWGLLRSSRGFDPDLLQPIVEVCCLLDNEEWICLQLKNYTLRLLQSIEVLQYRLLFD